jgi:hypothetical protein
MKSIAILFRQHPGPSYSEQVSYRQASRGAMGKSAGTVRRGSFKAKCNEIRRLMEDLPQEAVVIAGKLAGRWLLSASLLIQIDDPFSLSGSSPIVRHEEMKWWNAWNESGHGRVIGSAPPGSACPPHGPLGWRWRISLSAPMPCLRKPCSDVVSSLRISLLLCRGCLDWRCCDEKFCAASAVATATCCAEQFVSSPIKIMAAAIHLDASMVLYCSSATAAMICVSVLVPDQDYVLVRHCLIW